ncbi:hypothetical protein G7054_g3614 [Neopestalotiopsis clavispora]|nr:hypothetical protein G7054_g3614 [Neopestalotiopsis clavispora]
MSSLSTYQAQQSQGGSGTSERDHFVEAPYNSESVEQVSKDSPQHLAERRKPDRFVPRDKGTKAGRSELEAIYSEALARSCGESICKPGVVPLGPPGKNTETRCE